MNVGILPLGLDQYSLASLRVLARLICSARVWLGLCLGMQAEAPPGHEREIAPVGMAPWAALGVKLTPAEAVLPSEVDAVTVSE